LDFLGCYHGAKPRGNVNQRGPDPVEAAVDRKLGVAREDTQGLHLELK
jgi:hypothetical protein